MTETRDYRGLPSQDRSKLKAISAEVHGLVQGVAFRYVTRQTAQELGVVGWVRNLPTGAVEVWAQGSAEAVERLRTFLESGPRGAVVERVDIDDVEPDPLLSGFEIRF